jgi:calpain-7
MYQTSTLIRLWYFSSVFAFDFPAKADHMQSHERQVFAAGSQPQALEAAIAAAENYMKALKIAQSPREKQWLDSKCKDWLSRAERIKHDKAWKAENPLLKEPVSKRKLSTREEIIILESAKLNGFLFPPWNEAPDPQEFELTNDGKKFE